MDWMDAFNVSDFIGGSTLVVDILPMVQKPNCFLVLMKSILLWIFCFVKEGILVMTIRFVFNAIVQLCFSVIKSWDFVCWLLSVHNPNALTRLVASSYFTEIWFSAAHLSVLETINWINQQHLVWEIFVFKSCWWNVTSAGTGYGCIQIVFFLIGATKVNET
jgi:hypothetical protein